MKEGGGGGGGNLENTVYLGRDHRNCLDVTSIVCTASAATEVWQCYRRAGLFGVSLDCPLGNPLVSPLPIHITEIWYNFSTDF